MLQRPSLKTSVRRSPNRAQRVPVNCNRMKGSPTRPARSFSSSHSATMLPVLMLLQYKPASSRTRGELCKSRSIQRLAASLRLTMRGQTPASHLHPLPSHPLRRPGPIQSIVSAGLRPPLAAEAAAATLASADVQQNPTAGLESRRRRPRLRRFWPAAAPLAVTQAETQLDHSEVWAAPTSRTLKRSHPWYGLKWGSN